MAFALVCFAISLLTYPLTLGAPVMLLALDWIYAGQRRLAPDTFRRLAIEKLPPFLAVSTAVLAVTFCARSSKAGVVDEQVERVGTLDPGLDGLHAGVVRKVGRKNLGAYAMRRGQFTCEGLKQVPPPGNQDQVAAPGREPACEGPPNPAGGSCDQGKGGHQRLSCLSPSPDGILESLSPAAGVFGPPGGPPLPRSGTCGPCPAFCASSPRVGGGGRLAGSIPECQVPGRPLPLWTPPAAGYPCVPPRNVGTPPPTIKRGRGWFPRRLVRFLETSRARCASAFQGDPPSGLRQSLRWSPTATPRSRPNHKVVPVALKGEPVANGKAIPNVIGVCFLLRFLIRDREDVERVVKTLAFACMLCRIHDSGASDGS